MSNVKPRVIPPGVSGHPIPADWKGGPVEYAAEFDRGNCVYRCRVSANPYEQVWDWHVTASKDALGFVEDGIPTKDGSVPTSPTGGIRDAVAACMAFIDLHQDELRALGKVKRVSRKAS